MTEHELIRATGFALEERDWARLDAVCEELAAAIRRQKGPPSRLVIGALSELRRKRRFGCMRRVADAVILGGEAPPVVRRQYAQALIDQGELAAAIKELVSLIADAAGTAEEAEAKGLLGRAFKQTYVDPGGGDPAVLQRALDEYSAVFKINRRKHIWHGINVVALLARATKDGVAVRCDLTVQDTAEQLLGTIESAEADNFGTSDPWLTATALEALIALGRYQRAEERAIDYTTFGAADAFEINSTLRQLEEVWGLRDDAEPGASILPLLRAALMRRSGGGMVRGAQSITSELKNIDGMLQKKNNTGSRLLSWYRNGLLRAAAVARIERPDDAGVTNPGQGTGWLVRSRDLFQTDSDEPVLVTNAHVVCETPGLEPGAFTMDEVIANFEVAGHKSGFARVVWCSGSSELDCTVLRLTAPPPIDVLPLPLSQRRVRQFIPAPRMYIIGHPGGRSIEFSLQDNHLLECDERVLRYRTSTEDGSSGSPVFDENWNVVGLHHAGDRQMPRLDDPSVVYDANEGTVIRAIRSATGKCPFEA